MPGPYAGTPVVLVESGGNPITVLSNPLAGNFVMSDPASQIIPGITSFAVRNNANTFNNLLITDAGNATVRGTLVLTGSGASGVSTLTVSDAKVIPDDVTTIRQIVSAPGVTSLGSVTPGASSNAYYGISMRPTLSGTKGLGSIYATYSEVTLTTSGGTQVAIGAAGRVYLGGSGDVQEPVGVYATVNTTGGSGTVNTGSGVEIHCFNEAQGTTAFTEFRGLNIPGMALTTTTAGNLIGAYIGQPTGGTTQNIGLLVGAINVLNHQALIYAGATFADPVVTFEGVSINPVVGLTGNNAQTMYGLGAFFDTPTTTSNNYTGSLYGELVRARHFGTGAVTTEVGLYSQALLSPSGGAADGNITLAIAVRGINQNLGTAVTPGVIASSYVFRAEGPSFGSTGTINNQYGYNAQNQGNAKVTGSSWGIRVEAQSGSTVHSYALETLGGEVRFTPNLSQARASNSIWGGVSILASTLTFTSAGNITTATGVNLVNIAIPAIVMASGAITSSATVAILGQPTISGGATITLPLALDVQGGNVRIGTNVANGVVACVLTANSGPAGANAAVQEWFVIYNAAGVARYIPSW